MRTYMKRLGLTALMLGVASAVLCVILIPHTTVQTAPQTQNQKSTPEPSQEALNYLNEIALSGFEFGQGPQVAHKWTKDVLVEVTGTPSFEDRQALKTVISDLAPLIAPIGIREVTHDGNVTVFYGPDSQFRNQVPDYVDGNRGYFSLSLDGSDRIYHSDIVISSEMSNKVRAHLLREELTQSLGLVQDSWAHKDSMFYQGWTTTPQFSELDKETIHLLYDERVAPGMTVREVRAIFG